MADQRTRRRRELLVWGGTVGFGFGAIVDVLVFHLILQTHHILSGFFDPYSYDGLRTNVMFDGVFTSIMLGIMLVGLAMLWRTVNGTDERYSTLYLVGAIVVGMGTFNVLDGVFSHYVLDLHNVVHGTEAWNPPWLVVSVLLFALGVGILRLADRREAA